MTKIEELEQKLNECQKALAELKESKKEGKWKPAQDDEIWFRNMEGKASYLFYHEGIDIKSTPVFPTKERCERYWHFMDTVKEKSYEFSNLDWRDDDIVKWVIEYDYVSKQLRVGDHRYIKHFGLIYFKDKESAQFIIDNFGEELEKYWL